MPDDITACDMSRYWRLVSVSDCPVTGTFWVSRPDQQGTLVQAVKVTVWADPQRTWGRVVTDMIAWVKGDAVPARAHRRSECQPGRPRPRRKPSRRPSLRPPGQWIGTTALGVKRVGVSAMTEIDAPTCARGCTEHGQHRSVPCDPDCRGCAGSPTHEGTSLCYRCWKTLRYSLANAQGQHDLLLSLAALSMSLAPTDDAGMIRGSSDDLPDAINVSRLSCAQEISDVLSQWVEWMVADHEIRGPKRLMTQHQRDVPGCSSSWSEYTGRYEGPSRPPDSRSAPHHSGSRRSSTSWRPPCGSRTRWSHG